MSEPPLSPLQASFSAKWSPAFIRPGPVVHCGSQLSTKTTASRSLRTLRVSKPVEPQPITRHRLRQSRYRDSGRGTGIIRLPVREKSIGRARRMSAMSFVTYKIIFILFYKLFINYIIFYRQVVVIFMDDNLQKKSF